MKVLGLCKVKVVLV